MLFFKDVKADFMDSPDFRVFYGRECHICAHTMALVSRLTEMGAGADALLRELDISPEVFRDLAEGDCCDPEIVDRLVRALGMDRAFLNQCPGRQVRSKSALSDEKGGQRDGRP